MSASKVREKCVGLDLGLEMGAAFLEFIGRVFENLMYKIFIATWSVKEKSEVE